MQILVEKAEKEPAVYLDQVVGILNADNSRTGWKQHPRLLALFFRQFESEPPDPILMNIDPDSIDNDTGPCALDAFHGLYLSIPGKGVGSFKRQCIIHWPSMWKWIDFVLRQNPGNGGYFDNFNLAVISILFNVFEGGIHPSIAATKGLLGLCFTLHVEHPTRPSASASEMEVICSCISDLLRTDGADMKEIRTEIGYNSRKAARKLFYPGYSCIRRSDASWGHCLATVQRIHTQMCEKYSEIYRSLSTQTVMTYICDSLTFALSLEYVGVDPLPIIMTLAFLWKYATYGSDTYAWIVYGLRNGLLSALVAAANVLQLDHSAIPVISELLSIISCNSIHRPILHLLNDIETVIDPTSIKQPQIRSAWDGLLAAVSWARESREEYRDTNVLPRCSNSKCQVTEYANERRRCGGCHTLYCSKECQELDWKHHKKSCGPHYAYRSSLQRPYTRGYFDLLMIREMGNRLEEVQGVAAQIKAEAPHIPRCVFMLDLTREIPPASASFTMHPNEIPVTNSQPHPLILPCVKVQYGSERRILPVAIPIFGNLFG